MSALLLALTHSARPMDFNRASLHHLTRRYASSARLTNPPPLRSLNREASPQFTGNVTLWLWDQEREDGPRLVEFIRKPYKAQHAIIAGDDLVICGTSHLEIFALAGAKESPRAVITHPWFAGGHTVFVNGDGHYVVSCSAPDAVLVFDRTGKLRAMRRVPESLYGRNYDLQPTDDLREHYIPNDLQLTHLNCGYPTPRGLLCSMLIPGAVGLFDDRGGYREILRGYVGCHAAKWHAADDTIYFADSCNGNVVELDWDGRISRRHRLDSVWLQDVDRVSPELYLAGLSDRNEFMLYDAKLGRARWILDCREFGATTQFCSWSSLPADHRFAAQDPGRYQAKRTQGTPVAIAHAKEKFCTDALVNLIDAKPPLLPAILNWAQVAPNAHLFSAAQWLQIASTCRMFQPDLILEVGSIDGRVTAALACGLRLLDRSATLVTCLQAASWQATAGETAARPVLGTAATRIHPVSGLAEMERFVSTLLAGPARVFVLCSDLDQGNFPWLVRWLLPRLAERPHLVVFCGISDGRQNQQLAYTDGGGDYLVLGDAIAAARELPRLVDFVSRNSLTLFSVDTALAGLRERDPGTFNRLKGLLDPAFADQGHWRWLTLNEKTGPFVFPAAGSPGAPPT